MSRLDLQNELTASGQSLSMIAQTAPGLQKSAPRVTREGVRPPGVSHQFPRIAVAQHVHDAGQIAPESSLAL